MRQIIIDAPFQKLPHEARLMAAVNLAVEFMPGPRVNAVSLSFGDDQLICLVPETSFGEPLDIYRWAAKIMPYLAIADCVRLVEFSSDQLATLPSPRATLLNFWGDRQEIVRYTQTSAYEFQEEEVEAGDRSRIRHITEVFDRLLVDVPLAGLNPLERWRAIGQTGGILAEGQKSLPEFGILPSESPTFLFPDMLHRLEGCGVVILPVISLQTQEATTEMLGHNIFTSMVDQSLPLDSKAFQLVLRSMFLPDLRPRKAVEAFYSLEQLTALLEGRPSQHPTRPSWQDDHMREIITRLTGTVLQLHNLHILDPRRTVTPFGSLTAFCEDTDLVLLYRNACAIGAAQLSKLQAEFEGNVFCTYRGTRLITENGRGWTICAGIWLSDLEVFSAARALRALGPLNQYSVHTLH